MIVGEDGQPASPMDSKSSASAPILPPAYPQQYAGPAPQSYQQGPGVVYYNQGAAAPLQRPSEPASSRFLKALACAGAIYLVFALLTRGVVDIGRRHGIGGIGGSYEAGPEPGDGTATSCLAGHDWIRNQDSPPVRNARGLWEVSASFELPSVAPALYLLSRGVRQRGAVRIEPGSHKGDTVKVALKATYDWKNVIDKAKVCLLQDGDKHGLGIYTPTKWWHEDHYRNTVNWDLVLTLPANAKIDEFATNLPNFSHKLGDLAKTYDFDTISLHGTNSPIYVKSLKAKSIGLTTTNAAIYADAANAASAHVKTTNAGVSGSYSADELQVKSTNGPITGSYRAYTLNIVTTNAPIAGTYNSTDSLKLVTTNGAVKAHVFVANDLAQHRSKVEVHTTNAIIDSIFTLLNASHSGNAPANAYDVKAYTSNAPLKLTFPSAPLDSELRLNARTTNDRATIDLPAEFEGSFHAQTTHSGVSVVHDDKMKKDPAGKGRKRIIHTEKAGKGSVQGSVSWGGDGKSGKGAVDVTTTHGSIVILL